MQGVIYLPQFRLDLRQLQGNMVISVRIRIGAGDHEYLSVQPIEQINHAVYRLQDRSNRSHIVFQPQGMIARLQFKEKHGIPAAQRHIGKAQMCIRDR